MLFTVHITSLVQLIIFFNCFYTHQKQNGENGGKCSVCGEDYAETKNKFEPGPANVYATGTLVAEYQQGQTSMS